MAVEAWVVVPSWAGAEDAYPAVAAAFLAAWVALWARRPLKASASEGRVVKAALHAMGACHRDPVGPASVLEVAYPVEALGGPFQHVVVGTWVASFDYWGNYHRQGHRDCL